MCGNCSVLFVCVCVCGELFEGSGLAIRCVVSYTDTTSSILTERDDQCGNQHYSRELLMMDIVVPETC